MRRMTKKEPFEESLAQWGYPFELQSGRIGDQVGRLAFTAAQDVPVTIFLSDSRSGCFGQARGPVGLDRPAHRVQHVSQEAQGRGEPNPSLGARHRLAHRRRGVRIGERPDLQGAHLVLAQECNDGRSPAHDAVRQRGDFDGRDGIAVLALENGEGIGKFGSKG